MAVNVLIATGLVLFVITLGVNGIARWTSSTAAASSREPTDDHRHRARNRAASGTDRAPRRLRAVRDLRLCPGRWAPPGAAPGFAAVVVGARLCCSAAVSASPSPSRRSATAAIWTPASSRVRARRRTVWSPSWSPWPSSSRWPPGVGGRHGARQRHRPLRRRSSSPTRCAASSARAAAAYHAIIGTLIITALAAIMSIPIGLLTAIYLVEYGRGRLARRSPSSSTS